MIDIPWLKWDYRQDAEFVNREFSNLVNKYLKVPILIIAVSALSFYVSACSLINRGDSKELLESEQIIGGEAKLLCSSECKDRGQCGTSDENEMILLNSAAPATFGHDMAIGSGTNVTIVEQENLTAVQLADSKPLSVTFYLVNIKDTESGWVAGWCVGE